MGIYYNIEEVGAGNFDGLVATQKKVHIGKNCYVRSNGLSKFHWANVDNMHELFETWEKTESLDFCLIHRTILWPKHLVLYLNISACDRQTQFLP